MAAQGTLATAHSLEDLPEIAAVAATGGLSAEQPAPVVTIAATQARA